MRRGLAFGLFFACGVGGVVLAFAVAVTPVAGADGGTTGTVATTPEPPTATDSTTTTTTTAAPSPHVIAAGVTIGHLAVGGLSFEEARAAVAEAFAKPLTLVVSPTRRFRITPNRLGAYAHLTSAVRSALSVRRNGFNVPLPVDVSAIRIDRYASALGRKVDRAPIDSRLILYKLAPRITKDLPGRHLNRVVTARLIVLALKTQARTPITLRFQAVRPAVTPASFKHVIVIRRGSHELTLYKRDRIQRQFGVATGQSIYPTPLGRFEVIVKLRNPWWYPPAGSAWAKGEKPVPPGPGNPLGTRWMGISAPNVGIHGTPDAASIGYSASHGCIRMRIPDAEWLFEHVEIGTTVFIVGA
jgi:lipoprotein-anchoring transpeptidase ErfK/SrfK